MEEIVLKIPCGEIIGYRTGEADCFPNIPFATAERFAPSVPIGHFDGAVDTRGPGIECPQFSAYEKETDQFYATEYRTGQTFVYREDTLYLSVIAPQQAKNCPVLVHIYGGGFVAGKHSEHPAAESMEYAKRGIVLVSVSYRVNIFGLFRSRNLYISDQLCGLQWVKNNIAAFGGDPENITLIGESAGGISIFNLLFCREFSGLAKRAVIMSGIMLMPRFLSGLTPEASAKCWDAVMRRAGAEDEAELQKVPAEMLWHAWRQENTGLKKNRLNQPAIDGKYVTDCAARMVREREMADIPLIIGVTAQDMYIPFLMFSYAKRFADWWCRNKKENIYVYYFDRFAPGNRYRAFHCADLCYVFGNMQFCRRRFEKEDEKMKDVMVDAVAGFAASGDPGWEPFRADTKRIRRFHTAQEEYLTGIRHYGELLLNTFIRRGPM